MKHNTRLKKRDRKSALPGSFRLWFWLLLLGATGLTGWYVYQVSARVNQAFDLHRGRQPAHVYSRPLRLEPGKKLSLKDLLWELDALGFRRSHVLAGAGSYAVRDNSVQIQQRPFRLPDGETETQPFEVSFTDNSISGIRRYADHKQLASVWLEPLLIGSIFPFAHEDRLLLDLDEVPQTVIDTLFAIEDRSFHDHHGVDFVGILRALSANLRSGSTLQGGSTLTQQLVKNLFLTRKKTIHRKLVEMVMAFMIEARHSKREILQTYINEVYLGQSGQRAIHGLGLASQFYFARPLRELEAHQVALLVGMIRAPSQYNPRRHPEAALKRRNLVLREAAKRGVWREQQARLAEARPLDLALQEDRGTRSWHAFLELVRNQIHRDYRDEDIKASGLNIFSTLDPFIQRQAEAGLQSKLAELEKEHAKAKKLQGAVVITRASNGEVLAVVGDRNPTQSGFNRALNARRQTGSIIKPVIYLSALERPRQFTLSTFISDAPYVWRSKGAKPWTPRNYGGRYHGAVQLRQALAHSYNVASVRLGMTVGLGNVLDTARRIGIQQPLPKVPSALLGAIAIAPIDIVNMYQTIATGGYRIPLRAIRSVTGQDGKTLNRYPLRVDQAIKPGPAWLLINALQGVVREGTARFLNSHFPGYLGLAGKTGTTNGLHDTWFAGFSGNLVNVVWVGRDDNRSTGLTGSSGALRVWADIMSRLELEPVNIPKPANVDLVAVHKATGKRVARDCINAVELPYIHGSAPRAWSACTSAPGITPAPASDFPGLEGLAPQTEPRATEAPAQKPSKPARRKRSLKDFFRDLINIGD